MTRTQPASSTQTNDHGHRSRAFPEGKHTRLVFAAAASVILMVSLAACSSGASTGGGSTNSSSAASPSASAAPAGPTLGAAFEVKQNDGTAKITIVSATYGPALGGAFDIAPKNGGYLILDVLWETSAGTSSSNPLYIKAKSADGREGDIALGVVSQLGSGNVPTGDTSRGNVGFDIGAGPYTVVVTDQLLQDKARLTAVNASAR